MPARRPAALVVVAAVLIVGLGAGLLAARGAGTTIGRSGPSPAALDQVRADTLAGVAQTIYGQETFGSPNSVAFRFIRALPGLRTALETGNLRRARRTLNAVRLDHIVRVRVTRSGRALVDVGLPFVIAGQNHILSTPHGAYLGQIEVSIQDVIGLIKLFHRLTGAEIAVRGQAGHAKSSLPAIQRVALPATGPLRVGRRTYYVSSFTRVGFAGEPLRLWILYPAT
jgi:hypothetical protein